VKWSPGQRRQSEVASDLRSPLRRTEDLITEAIEDELLIYDRTNGQAHCLSRDAARVWQACDGSRDIAALSAELSLPSEVVRQALDELEASQLLDRGIQVVNVNGNGDGVTRRQAVARTARLGAAAASGPLILSIMAPAAMAVSPAPTQCQLYSSQNCGSTGGCGQIAGCCCCGTGGNCNSPCNVCSATDFCGEGQQPCYNGGVGGLSGGCSNVATGGGTFDQRGCCSQTPVLASCGCIFSGTQQNVGFAGAGCCHASVTPPTPCLPTETGAARADCFPCCQSGTTPNGPFVSFIAEGSTFGCCATATCTPCTPDTTTNTCT